MFFFHIQTLVVVLFLIVLKAEQQLNLVICPQIGATFLLSRLAIAVCSLLLCFHLAFTTRPKVDKVLLL